MGYVLVFLAAIGWTMLMLWEPAPKTPELVTYHNANPPVTCYRAAYKDGISCIPDWLLTAPGASK